ncbi:MAG: HAD family hydrolase [Spirochaetales bacterium]|nr:HAD family hydrolase [Spirochaetales bacterium]
MKPIVFFDIGWTLEDEADAQAHRARSAVAALERRGIAVTPERILELQEEGASAMAPSVFAYALRRMCPEEIAGAVEAESEWNKDLLRLYPDARPTVGELHRTATLGIIANQSAGARERLERYGVAHLFATIHSSHDVGAAKPDKAIFTSALAAVAGDVETVWMVGDRIDNDIVPARALGWRTIWIRRGYNRFQNPIRPEEMPDVRVDTLSEIPAIVAAGRGT